MRLEHVALLQKQRELYGMPRGMERFREYVRVMVGGSDDLRLPLTAMNPMAREHVPARLDEWIALDAEAVAAGAERDAARRLSRVDAAFKSGLVIADDAHGGWTNRYTSDASQRFEAEALRQRGWVTTILWASEPASRESLRAAVLCTVYRSAHALRFGEAKTLAERMTQEGRAARFAELRPSLAGEALARARAVLRPHFDAVDTPTWFAALYGDDAAAQLGHTPLGLPPFAGFDVALADALGNPQRPEDAL